MRFIVADWGTSRFRAYVVEDGAIVDRVASDEGVSALKPGEHAGVRNRDTLEILRADGPCRGVVVPGRQLAGQA